jgi:hypothetical protein
MDNHYPEINFEKIASNIKSDCLNYNLGALSDCYQISSLYKHKILEENQIFGIVIGHTFIENLENYYRGFPSPATKPLNIILPRKVVLYSEIIDYQKTFYMHTFEIYLMLTKPIQRLIYCPNHIFKKMKLNQFCQQQQGETLKNLSIHIVDMRWYKNYEEALQYRLTYSSEYHNKKLNINYLDRNKFVLTNISNISIFHVSLINKYNYMDYNEIIKLLYNNIIVNDVVQNIIIPYYDAMSAYHCLKYNQVFQSYYEYVPNHLVYSD